MLKRKIEGWYADSVKTIQHTGGPNWNVLYGPVLCSRAHCKTNVKHFVYTIKLEAISFQLVYITYLCIIVGI